MERERKNKWGPNSWEGTWRTTEERCMGGDAGERDLEKSQGLQICNKEPKDCRLRLGMK
jgi:hypothetical protein